MSDGTEESYFKALLDKEFPVKLEDLDNLPVTTSLGLYCTLRYSHDENSTIYFHNENGRYTYRYLL